MNELKRGSRTVRLVCTFMLIAFAVLAAATPLLAQEAIGLSRQTRGTPSPELNYDSDVVTPQSHTSEGVFNLGIDPVGTFTNFSATFDCGSCLLGFGASRWDFTVTVPTDITVEVNDCCVEGDRFEARCNNRNVDEDGNSDLNNHEEDCIIGREVTNVPVGTFANVGTVTLDPGDWTVRIRDVQFQCGTSNPGCPAGYTMRISFGPPTGTPCAGLASCFNPTVPDSCRDSSLPRDPGADMLEAKLDALEPQIMALEMKLDQLEIEVSTIIQLLNAIEAKLDVPEACDQSNPMTCDGDCPMAGDICTQDAAGGPCTCVTPCDLSDPAVCDGDCPLFGQICQASTPPGGPCGCVTPPVPCDQSNPSVCDGDCPVAGDVCTVVAGAACTCVTPCDLSDPAVCDGQCPMADQVCTPSTPPGAPCVCEVPPVPCDQSDPATCDGTCPVAGEICTLDAAGFCFCEPPGGFCDDPVNPCTPCALGTVCFDGTPCGSLPGCP